MADLVLDGGDFVVSNHGDLLLHTSADDNIIQMANSAISTALGENIFHLGYGNDAWNKRLKMSRSGFDVIESCSKEAILSSNSDITDVISIEATKGNGDGECIVGYTLLTSDGKTISSKTSINIL